MQKGFSAILIIVGILVLISLGAGGYYFYNQQQSLVVEEQILVPPAQPSASIPVMRACTLEAKLCPDGSSVGRTGPNCEFAPCPGE